MTDMFVVLFLKWLWGWPCSQGWNHLYCRKKQATVTGKMQDLIVAFLKVYLPPVLAVITLRLTVVWLNTLRWLARIGSGLLASVPTIFRGNNTLWEENTRAPEALMPTRSRLVFTLTIAIAQWIGPCVNSFQSSSMTFINEWPDMEHLDPDLKKTSSNHNWRENLNLRVLKLTDTYSASRYNMPQSWNVSFYPQCILKTHFLFVQYHAPFLFYLKEDSFHSSHV